MGPSTRRADEAVPVPRDVREDLPSSHEEVSGDSQ
jgi:hypothetical protein